MGRKRRAWAGAGVAGGLAGVAVLLGPVTNYASATVPKWAARPMVIWPVFAGLAAVSALLVVLGRRLDAAPEATALIPVGAVAAARLSSLRPPHVAPERVRGREPELARLSALLRRPGGRYAVVCAAGGIGKTTLASTLAHRAEQDGYAVFWIRWRETATLAEQLTQAAIACGLPQHVLEAAQAGQDNLPDVVWAQFAATRKWLIVLDNADQTGRIGPDGESIADYRGWIRPRGGGLLLVTSRDTNPYTWGDAAELLRLQPLTTAEGAHVLLDAAPGAGTREEAETLAARVGGLPLALQAIARYLTKPTSRYRTFTAYCEALEHELPSLIGAEDPNAADPEVARTLVRHTWELSLDQLTAEGVPLARPLLRLLALFSEAPIPLSLVTPALLASATAQPVTPVALDDALTGLERYNLLGVPDQTTPSDTRAIVLHPLVREISRLALNTDTSFLDPWHQAIVNCLVGAVDQVVVSGRPGWPMARLLTPHVPMLLDHERLIGFEDARDAVDALAEVLNSAGAAALQILLRRVVLDAETHILGPEHPDTLASRGSFATALSALGEYAQAVELHRQVLADRIRILGSDHLDTLSSRHDLAFCLNELGDFAQAAELNRQIVADGIRVLGAEHPSTLASRNNLAYALLGMGEYAQAVELHRQVLADRIRILGTDHPDTLISRNSLAATLNDVGDYAEAAELLRQTVADRIRILGPDHPGTLISRNNLAYSLSGLGHYAEAAELHRQTVADFIRVLGPDHPHTQASRLSLAATEAALRRSTPRRRLRALLRRRP